MKLRRLSLPALCLLAISCGSSTPPPSGTTYTVNALLFYDENDNGVLDSNEVVRIPNAKVTMGGVSGVSGPNGEVTLNGVPGGTTELTVDSTTLPPYYALAPYTVQVPASSLVMVPVTLPIGTNIPNTYMGFGDSITVGDNSTSGAGYRDVLQSKLQAYLGAATVINDGIDATRSLAGSQRIAGDLPKNTPAFILIQYGTNDWNEGTCRDFPPCYTITSLQTIVNTAQAAHTLPFLATIIPVNVGYDDRVPPQRQTWVHNQDILIRAMAAQQGAVLVDLEAAFLNAAASMGGDLKPLFSDHVHPSDVGYALMADTFYKAIITPPTQAPSAAAVLLTPPRR